MNANKPKPRPTENILALLSNMADLQRELWIVPQKYNHFRVARAMRRTSVRVKKFKVVRNKKSKKFYCLI